MEFPEVFVTDMSGDEDAAARSLAQSVEGWGSKAPLVIASGHGDALAAHLEGPLGHERPSPAADQRWAATLGSRAHRAGVDAVIAIGGGRCLDLGKLAAARAGLILIAVPTQLSHDGICSPVAVVPDMSGKTQSLGAVTPRATFISLPTLIKAPAASARAGIGDLLANPFALKDWALAAERGLTETDDRAWGLSVDAVELISPFLGSDPGDVANDPAFARSLADALIRSGLAMICAGSSRPASGGEHEISHAIDLLFGGRAMHGAQVAFGCIFSAALYGEDAGGLRARLRTLGLPDSPSALGLSHDEVVEVLLAAPDTRPGRFTILEESNLDEKSARALVNDIWTDDDK